MLRRIAGSVLVAGALLLVPSAAQANHHACPQVTITPNADGTSTINVARKNCAPTYVPYPIGGPKSPLISGANQTVPLNDAGPDLSCLRPNRGTPQGGDPPIPSPGSAQDPFPIEYVLKNGNLQLGSGQEVPIPQVCAPTVVRSDGSRVYLFADANIKTQGSVFELLLNIDLLLRGLI
jgi:hypothetical protein